ncbi:MAG: hypothetical protein HFG27_11340 [Provencibacterium sp.]|nr:hypothetical protein [Provencibacterium sp.]
MRIPASQMGNPALLYQTLRREGKLEKQAEGEGKAQTEKEASSPAMQLKKQLEEEAQKQKEAIQKMADEIKEQRNPWREAAEAMAKAASSGSGKVKVSAPDDSVGQLASELANAHSKLDVSTISGKAMRAMASLRMSLAFAEGKEKESIRRMITRMEKLQKRIRAKMKHLNKEEQLERRRIKAEKDQQMEKARSLKDELRSRRSRRRRDEHNYAQRELTEDWKENQAGNISASAGTAVSASAAATPVAAAAEIAAPAEVSAAPVADGALLDVHI